MQCHPQQAPSLRVGVLNNAIVVHNAQCMIAAISESVVLEGRARHAVRDETSDRLQPSDVVRSERDLFRRTEDTQNSKFLSWGPYAQYKNVIDTCRSPYSIVVVSAPVFPAIAA